MSILLLAAFGAYTNLAGNVVIGSPLTVTRREVTISNTVEQVTLPISIFSESEKRRIAADAGVLVFVPRNIHLAVEGNEKAIARSRKRAEMGLCTKELSGEFIERSRESLKRYLDGQVESGALMRNEYEVILRRCQ